jgi:DNA-binding LacI/PurR family transcriptional regulator
MAPTADFRIEPGEPAPTVLHVARQAGVSAATVSRALNGQVPVSPSTHARVMAAVDMLGYRLNTVARGLRKGQTNTVALLVGDIKQGHFGEMTKSVQMALESIGVELLLFNVGHSQERLAQFVVRASSMQLRAMAIAVSDAISAPVAGHLQALAASGTPVIAISQNLTRLGIHSLVHEERAAVTRSVEWLLGQGRKRIAYLGRIMHSAVSSERYRGYKTALVRAGRFDEALVLQPAYRYAGGHDTVLRALDAGLRFDGIQTASDELAAGAMAALRDRELCVPADVAVIGIGDIEVSSYLRPALTTWSSQHDTIARQLCAIIDGSTEQAPATLTLFPRELVRRESA